MKNNQLVIVFSGKKQSGKTSGCKFVISEYINACLGKKRFHVDDNGNLIDQWNSKVIDTDIPNSELDEFWNTFNVKLYSFADPLKQFLINVLNIDPRQCYGTDDEKNSPTHIVWDDMPREVRKLFPRPNRKTGRMKMASGIMSSRELMQAFGTEICRKLDINCWSRALYNLIIKDGYKLALVADARFPNEVSLGTEHNHKVIRLLRNTHNSTHASETALDNMALGEYSLVVRNSNMTPQEKMEHIKPHVIRWMLEYGIIPRP